MREELSHVIKNQTCIASICHAEEKQYPVVSVIYIHFQRPTGSMITTCDLDRFYPRSPMIPTSTFSSNSVTLWTPIDCACAGGNSRLGSSDHSYLWATFSMYRSSKTSRSLFCFQHRNGSCCAISCLRVEVNFKEIWGYLCVWLWKAVVSKNDFPQTSSNLPSQMRYLSYKHRKQFQKRSCVGSRNSSRLLKISLRYSLQDETIEIE